MALAADEYIYLMNHQHQIRFDIISILFDKFGKPIIKHIEDAFWP
jgi:putative endonuclease